MRSADLALILTGVMLNAVAQLLLKAGARTVAGLPVSFADAGVLAGRLIHSGPIFGGLACYAVSVVVWILALSRVPVSVAYPMLSIGYVVNLLAARVLFAEQITLQRVAGVGVIVAGCWLVARS